jgi:hypothetical protein
MYKALKSAQNEIQEALLKFADETSSLGQKVDTSKCPRGDPCQCALITQGARKAEPVENNQLKDIENTLQFLHQKQNAQYEVLVGGIQELNQSLANIVKILSQQTVETATIIPNLAPTAMSSDLKDVCVDTGFSHVGNLSEQAKTLETPMGIDEDDVSAIEDDGDITPDIEDADGAEEEVDEEADAEAQVEAEAEEVLIEEEEEGIEVEEWTYKGRKFFKDTENTVYANNNGELGDPIGLYDPVKNIVKKLPTSS